MGDIYSKRERFKNPEGLFDEVHETEMIILSKM